jgi:hypothetical protein
MNAIRQFIEVKDNSFNVVLPQDFKAQRVEVIILPSDAEDDIPQWQKDIVLERINHPKGFVDAFEMLEKVKAKK